MKDGKIRWWAINPRSGGSTSARSSIPGVIGLVFLGITLGPRIIKETENREQRTEDNGTEGVFGVAAYNQDAVSAFTQDFGKP